jgi:hypothetical protein
MVTALSGANGARDALRRLCDELGRIDGCGVGVPVARYDGVRAEAQSLFPDSALDLVLHVELRKPADRVELGAPVVAAFAEGAGVLQRLFSDQEDPLRRFKERFLERYEGRFVPLVEALDEELGIVSADPIFRKYGVKRGGGRRGASAAGPPLPRRSGDDDPLAAVPHGAGR